jgi:lysophospholipase L1-like esterase
MKKLSLIILLLIAFINLKAQDAPFYKDIQEFKKQDSIKFPPKNAVLFVGSSTFTKWKDVQAYFPNHVIINRGFGGSSLPDVIRYANDIIFPYEPKQIVIYCGENDFAITGGIEPEIVANRVKQLIDLIRTRYPKVDVAYISIKPSPSRKHLWSGMQKANTLIKDMISKMPNIKYINTADSMFNNDGTIMQDIFLIDNLHMNAKGYAIWQKIMEPYLK